MKYKLLLPLLIGLTFGQSLGQNEEIRTHIGPNYQISYPSLWTLSTEGFMGSKFLLISPRDSSGDTFSENINLIVEDVSGAHLNLDSYISLTLKQINKFITDVQILSNQQIVMSGDTSHQLAYTMRQGTVTLYMDQRYRFRNDSAYVLSLAMEENPDPLKRTECEGILQSFSFNQD